MYCKICLSLCHVALRDDDAVYVVMATQVIQMLYFTVFLLIIIVAYGVLLQSVWFPDKEFEWESVREIFIKPYFNLYGEVYADEVWRKLLSFEFVSF